MAATRRVAAAAFSTCSRMAAERQLPAAALAQKAKERRARAEEGGSESFLDTLRNWYIYAAGYRQLGLRRDDLHMEENSDVSTAISRLSEEDQNLRLFRIKRAQDLTMKHQILPEADWTKPEEDGLYLTPMIEKAAAERKEREELDRM